MSKLKNKRTKFEVGWDSAPKPASGSYSAPQDVLSEFLWAYSSKIRWGRKGKGGKGREERRRERKGERLCSSNNYLEYALLNCCRILFDRRGQIHATFFGWLHLWLSENTGYHFSGSVRVVSKMRSQCSQICPVKNVPNLISAGAPAQTLP